MRENAPNLPAWWYVAKPHVRLLRGYDGRWEAWEWIPMWAYRKGGGDGPLGPWPLNRTVWRTTLGEALRALAARP
jgi:hypothetical protein